MVIEVKREQNCSPDNLYVDILKLQKLVDEKLLNFQMGLFIAIGMTMYQLENKLQKNLTDKFKKDNNIMENNPIELLRKNPKDLYFIATDDIKSTAENDFCKYYFTAKELIKDIDKDHQNVLI